MKPKVNMAGDPAESKGYDRCQTPDYAVAPLLPYLRPNWTVWEPACGEGNIVRGIAPHVTEVIGTDLLADPPRNFFTYAPWSFDVVITNPPYSIKYDWLARCYALGQPFALLVPVETIGSGEAQALFRRYGVELLLLNRRVNFKMPGKGWERSSAQFPTLWLCWRLLGQPIAYGDIPLGAAHGVSQLLIEGL